MKSKLVLLIMTGAMALGASAPNAIAQSRAVAPRATARSASIGVSKASSHSVTKPRAAKKATSVRAIAPNAKN